MHSDVWSVSLMKALRRILNEASMKDSTCQYYDTIDLVFDVSRIEEYCQ